MHIFPYQLINKPAKMKFVVRWKRMMNRVRFESDKLTQAVDAPSGIVKVH